MLRAVRLPLVLILLALGPALAAQSDVARKVARLVELSADKGPEASWALARSLKSLGPGVVEALTPYLEKANPTFRIAAASTLLEQGEKEPGTRILLDLAADESRDSATRRMAVRVLGRQGDRIAAKGLKAVMDETLDPLLKLEAARALWDVSFNDRPEAKRVLRDFLKSEDPELQAAGALALAEIADFEVARKVLERLQDEPTPRGRLARSYLRAMESARQLEDAFYRNPRYVTRDGKFDLLEEVLRQIRQFHLTGDQRSEDELVETAVRSVLRAIDPHSAYLTAEERAERAHGRHLNLAHVGAVLDFDGRGVFSAIRVLPGSSALAAGLRTDDKIIEVNGWSTFDRDLLEVMNRVNGPEGTTVKLKVVRRGWQEPRDIELRRGRPVPCPVRGEMLPGHLGYVQVSCLSEETPRQLDAVLGRLAAEPLRGLVLDLRDNVGEDLTGAVGVADRFLEAGKLVVYLEGRNRLAAPREEIRTTGPATAPAVPLAVLVNERTASAAEVVAGALAYYRRGVVVGHRTLGRASVQRVLELTSKQGDRFVDLDRPNGRYDPGEPFTDLDKNGRWDPGEPFEDRPGKNEVWDPGEPFEDLNHDGKRNADEPFTDLNGNGTYDEPEPYEDVNRNGRYDAGPGILITVARLFLPDGTAIQRDVDSEGKVLNEGGVKPDVEADPMEWPGWKEEELSKLLEAHAFRRYLDGHWEKARETLIRLAAFDAGDPERYPDFSSFFESLGTHLEREDVAHWLRVFVRQRVAEAGLRPVPTVDFTGDFELDLQLQAAIRELLKRLDPPVEPKSIPEYATFAEPKPKPDAKKSGEEKPDEEKKPEEKKPDGGR
jgi:C-terminal peptidase prc